MASALSPTGWLTLSLLLASFAAAALGVARLRPWPFQVVAASLAFAAAAAGGVCFVNRYYDYYTSWSALIGDLQADNGATALPVRIPLAPGVEMPAVPSGPTAAPAVSGRWTVRRLQLPGHVSGVKGRAGLVVLPPPGSTSSPLPVLVLLHGEPGGPTTWTSALQLSSVLQREAILGQIRPMAVVLPDVKGGFADQQCLDAPGSRLATYLSVDLPADVEGALPVQPSAAGWAIGGLSEGAFCAADLALHHPSLYRAVAAMDGYFRPDLPAAVVRRVYQGKRRAAARDDLLTLSRTVRALPRFWVMAGTGNADDYRRAVRFATVLGRRQDVRFVTVDGGRHSPPAWRTALPELLRWVSKTLAGQHEGGSIDFPLTG